MNTVEYVYRRAFSLDTPALCRPATRKLTYREQKYLVFGQVCSVRPDWRQCLVAVCAKRVTFSDRTTLSSETLVVFQTWNLKMVDFFLNLIFSACD